MPDTFLETVAQLGNGDSATDLNDALIAVVDAVRQTGKKGVLTYTLTIAPASVGDVDTLMLKDDVKLKLPTLGRKATVMYATSDNTLSRKDPRQPELVGLRKPADVTPLKEAK